jgi:hypothetical protein
MAIVVAVMELFLTVFLGLAVVDADRCQPPRRAFSGLRDQRDPGSDAPR